MALREAPRIGPSFQSEETEDLVGMGDGGTMTFYDLRQQVREGLMRWSYDDHLEVYKKYDVDNPMARLGGCVCVQDGQGGRGMLLF